MIGEIKAEKLGILFVYMYALSIVVTRSGMTIATILTILAALFLFKDRKKEFLTNENYLILGVIATAFICSFFTDGGTHSAYLVVKKSLRFMPFIFFPIFLNKLEKIKIFIFMICISLTINFYKGIQIYTIKLADGRDMNNLRYESFTSINESAYTILGISFIILGALLYYIKIKDKKMIFSYTFFYIISIIIVVLTKTRGAWISLILGLGIFILYLNKKLFICSLLLGLLTIGIVLEAPVFQGNNYVKRIKSIKNIDSDSPKMRLILWKGGIKIFKDHPVFGVGKRNSAKFYKEYIDENKSYELFSNKYSKDSLYTIASESHPHNMYISTLAENGIIVFFAESFFALYMIWKVVSNLYNKKKRKELIYLISLGALLGTITFYFSGMFENSLDNFKLIGVYISSLIITVSCIKFKKNENKFNVSNEIDGLIITEIEENYDMRGTFFEEYNKRDLFKIGIKDEFVQDNIATSKRGVLRGLHLQINQSQSKLITVIKGRILDVIVDVRKESPTYGKYTSIELNSLDKKSIYIPKGMAHGFLSIEDDTIVSYKCGDYYDPKDEIGIRWDDKTLNIDWELEKYNIQEHELILSKKDFNNTTFEEFDKRFKEEL